MPNLMHEGYVKGLEDCLKGVKDNDTYNSSCEYGIGYGDGWRSNWRNGLFGSDEEKPRLFALIEVVGDYYGGVDEVKCLGIYETLEEAESDGSNLGGYVVELTEFIEKIK